MLDSPFPQCLCGNREIFVGFENVGFENVGFRGILLFLGVFGGRAVRSAAKITHFVATRLTPL